MVNVEYASIIRQFEMPTPAWWGNWRDGWDGLRDWFFVRACATHKEHFLT